MWFLFLPVLAPALFKGILLTIPRKSRNQRGVAGGDAFLLKCLGNFGDEFKQCETGVDKAFTLAGLLCESSYVITREFKESLKALGLFIGVHVYSLAVLDQLPFKRLLVGQRDDAGGDLRKLRKLRSAVATCASDNLETLCIGSGDNRLDQPLRFQAGGKLQQLSFVKNAPGIGGDSWSRDSGSIWNADLESVLIGLSFRLFGIGGCC